MELDCRINTVYEDLLFLDQRTFGDNDLEISLYGGLAGKTGAFFEFLFSKESSVFLPVELGLAGLDIDHAFATLALPAADNVHVDAGTLGGVKDGRPSGGDDLVIPGEEGYGAHLGFPFLVEEFADLCRVPGPDEHFPAGCLFDPSREGGGVPGDDQFPVRNLALDPEFLYRVPDECLVELACRNGGEDRKPFGIHDQHETGNPAGFEISLEREIREGEVDRHKHRGILTRRTDPVQPGIHLDGFLGVSIDILAEGERSLCRSRGKRGGDDDGCVLDNPKSDGCVFIGKSGCVQVPGTRDPGPPG